MDEVYQRLATLLGETIGVTVVFKRGERFSDIRTGKVDIAILCAYPCSEILQQYPSDILVIAAPVMNGFKCHDSRYNSVIVQPTHETHNSSVIEWQNLTIGYNETISHSGFRVLAEWLYSQNKKAVDLKAWHHTGSHQNSIKALISGEIDIAAIDRQVWLREKFIASHRINNLKVIASTPYYPNTPWVIRQSLPSDLTSKITSFFLNLHQHPEGLAILKQAQQQKIVAIDAKDYLKLNHLKDKVRSFFCGSKLEGAANHCILKNHYD